MHGQNVMADISAWSQSFHFGFCPYILILSHCMVSQPLIVASNLVSSDSKFWPSHHDARKEGGNTGLAHTASAMRQEPWHIVASTTLNNSATWVSYTHRSILYPTPVIRDTQHCVQWTQDEHIPMLHSSTNTTMYIWCPNLFPRHFLWNTNAPCTMQLTQACPTMHCIHLV